MDTTRHNQTQQDTTRHNLTQLDTTGQNRTKPDTTRHNKTQQDTTRHNQTQPDTTKPKYQSPLAGLYKKDFTCRLLVFPKGLVSFCFSVECICFLNPRKQGKKGGIKKSSPGHGCKVRVPGVFYDIFMQYSCTIRLEVISNFLWKLDVKKGSTYLFVQETYQSLQSLYIPIRPQNFAKFPP